MYVGSVRWFDDGAEERPHHQYCVHCGADRQSGTGQCTYVCMYVWMNLSDKVDMNVCMYCMYTKQYFSLIYTFFCGCGSMQLRKVALSAWPKPSPRSSGEEIFVLMPCVLVSLKGMYVCMYVYVCMFVCMYVSSKNMCVYVRMLIEYACLFMYMVLLFDLTYYIHTYIHTYITSKYICSDMTKDLPKETILPSIPLKRFGTPEEVAVSNHATMIHTYIHTFIHTMLTSHTYILKSPTY